MAGGTTSGYQPVTPDAASVPSMTITVNDTKPLWFYCQQQAPKSHCGSGMVFAVNAVENSPRNFTAFKALATTLNGTNTTGASSSSSSGNGASTGVAFSSALSLGALVAAAAVLL